MIQELLGSGGGGGSSAPKGKTSIGFSTQPVFTASSNAPSTTKENISATTQQNLRCPRCDSTNTKFCYYNNYNLTQPRHFCKTCRRYWTKGGTLRNVPIGGGCRKNKTSSHVSAGGSSSATSGLLKPSSNIAMGMANYKAKPTLSTEMLLNGNSGFLGNMDPYSDLQNPPIWPSIQQGQSSHILALLRGATQFSNPNPNSNSSHVFTPLKSEGNNTTLGLDAYGNGAPSIIGSFLRGNQQSLNGYGLGGPDVQNGGNNNSNILDLYQRLKSSGNYNYCGNDQNHGSMIFGNNAIGSSSSSPSPSTSAMNFEGSSGGGDHLGGYGMMNSSMGISGWSDFPTIPINGAFP